MANDNCINIALQKHFLKRYMLIPENCHLAFQIYFISTDSAEQSLKMIKTD